MFNSNEWKLRISGHLRVATFGKTKKIDSDFHGVRGSAPFIKCQTNWQAKEINRITLSNEWRSPSNVNIGPVQRGALSADTYAAPLQKWSFKPIFVPFSQHSGSGWSTWGWRLERTGFFQKNWKYANERSFAYDVIIISVSIFSRAFHGKWRKITKLEHCPLVFLKKKKAVDEST